MFILTQLVSLLKRGHEGTSSAMLADKIAAWKWLERERIHVVPPAIDYQRGLRLVPQMRHHRRFSSDVGADFDVERRAVEKFGADSLQNWFVNRA